MHQGFGRRRAERLARFPFKRVDPQMEHATDDLLVACNDA
jgi:hypothetical protein